MKLKYTLLCLFASLALVGCDEESDNKQNNIGGGGKSVIDGDDGSVVDGDDGSVVDGGDELVIAPKNTFLLSPVTPTPILRDDPLDGYDLDDVLVQKIDENTLRIVNDTPRYIFRPVILINDLYFRQDQLIKPFEYIDIRKPELIGEIKTAQYVEEYPFFKSYIGYYYDRDDGDVRFSEPTETDIYNYEKEMRGLKNLSQSYDFNARFLNVMHSRSTTRTGIPHEHDDSCDWVEDTTPERSRTASSVAIPGRDFIRANVRDTDIIPTKHISMQMSKPDSDYTMLIGGTANGVATKASGGYLSVRYTRLYQPGRTAPQSTYFHEKMHNHGFGHDGGMTYGFSDVINGYVNNNWSNFFDDGVVEQQRPTLIVEYEAIDHGDDMELLISFVDKNAELESERIIDQFLLSTSETWVFKEAAIIYANGNRTPVSPDGPAIEHSYMFNSVPNVKAKGLNYANNKGASSDKISLRFRKMTSYNLAPSNAPTSMIFVAGNKNEPMQLSSLAMNYPGRMGSLVEGGGYAFYETPAILDSNGYFTKTVFEYTPEEARDYCKDKGLTLGTLHPYKSQEMLNFQNKHFKGRTQIGLSYETGDPVAIQVKSLTDMQYLPKGNLIYCVSI